MNDPKNTSNILGGSFANKHIQNGYFHKDAKGLGSKKLIEEINFINSLPNNLKQYFPKIVEYSIREDFAYLKEEYFELPNLRCLLFDGKFGAKDAIKVLSNILSILQKYGYDRKSITPPADYLDQYHFDRVWKRIEHTVRIAPIFKKVVSAKAITINGKTYLNIPQIIDFLRSSSEMRIFLTPKKIYPYVHGDLHLENILVSSDKFSFKLVDPRGYSYCDIYYDLGKISHSLNGKYDFIHEKKFKLSWRFKRKAAIDVLLEFEKNNALCTYEAINNMIVDVYRTYTNDQHALIRVLFNEAMHFSSDMPFHLANDGKEEKSLAIYFTGVRVLNEFLSLYGKILKRDIVQAVIKEGIPKKRVVNRKPSEKLVKFYL